MKKNANANVKVAKEEKKEIIQINLDKFEKQLENVSIKEIRQRETIYVYPDDFSKSDINSEKGKKYRNSIRNNLKRHCNNILIFAKSKDSEKLQKEIKEFELFYKEKFRLNDFSLSSISQSKDAGKEKDLSLMIEIIKECKK